MMGVSMSTLTTTTARPPEKVVVTGLGVVGFLAAQIFAHCGYEVIACEPDARRREIARACGLERVLPSVPLQDPKVARQVSLVVECSGHEQAVLDGCRVVRKRGEVVMVGVPWRQRSEMAAFDVLSEVFFHYVVLRSGWEWELPHQPTPFRTNSIWGNFAGALRWLAQGAICVEDVCEIRPPREAQEAYQDLLHRRCAKLSVMFDWTDCP
jgi:threonine dehydrogenase-like Zn-dependent dehydrogenase